MNWIIDAVAGVMLTSFTGSILFIGWFCLGRIIERRGYINIMYPMLRAVMCFFIIPMAYMILFISTKMGMFGGDLFLHTAELFNVGRIVHYIWFLSILAAASYFLYDWLKLLIAYRTAFDCDIDVVNHFERIREEMGIPTKRIVVLRSYRAYMPFIKGWIHPTVIIPVKEYSEQELRVIFIHELNHYKQRDILFKIMTILIVIFQSWNPLVWLFLKKMDEWGEYACDFKSCDMAGGMQVYFNVIISMVEKKESDKRIFRMTMAKKKDEINRRIERMKNYRSPKQFTRKAVALICAAVMLISSASVITASVGIGNGYQKIYEATEVLEVEMIETENGIEYEERGHEPGITEEIGETVGGLYADVRTFSWTVYANTRRRTFSFHASSGQQILVAAAIDPTDKTVDVGIIEPDGTRRYVQGEDIIMHTFNLDQTGYYMFFVENHNSTSVEASGSYQIVKLYIMEE